MLFIAELKINKGFSLFYGDPRTKHLTDSIILELGGRYLWPTEDAMLAALDAAGMAAVEDIEWGFTYVVPA